MSKTTPIPSSGETGSTVTASEGHAPAAAEPRRRGREAWWKLMDFDLGIIPVPVYVALVALLIAFTLTNAITGELAMVIAIMTVAAFTLGEIGKRLPLIRQIGGAAILVTFIPSLIAYLGWIPAPMVKAVGGFFDSSKLLNLFIAAVIVGSILSMDRRILIKGFVKIFVPLIVGSVAAIAVGTGIGTLLGLGTTHTLFYIVAPIMAGGVGEGAVPLTLGYSSILHLPQGEALARVLPPIMVGNLTAVLFAGVLAFVGRKRPTLSGNGQLQPGGDDLVAATEKKHPMDIQSMAAAGMLAITCYLTGTLAAKLWGWPAPVVMLALAVILTLAHGVSPRIQAGSTAVYKFALTTLAFPVLFTFSLTQTPWQSLVAGFAPANLITIVATVAAMVGGGFLAARWVNLYPVEAAIIAATHSGMGGAGDIAILTASNRMRLMPFAQIATRIGGGITVTIALLTVGNFLH